MNKLKQFIPFILVGFIYFIFEKMDGFKNQIQNQIQKTFHVFGIHNQIVQSIIFSFISLLIIMFLPKRLLEGQEGLSQRERIIREIISKREEINQKKQELRELREFPEEEEFIEDEFPEEEEFLEEEEFPEEKEFLEDKFPKKEKPKKEIPNKSQVEKKYQKILTEATNFFNTPSLASRRHDLIYRMEKDLLLLE